MGNVQDGLDKGIQVHITSEYERVRKDKTRDYLNISEILQLQSQEEYPFTFSHLGVLYVLDDDKDGRVEIEELTKFGIFCSKHMKNQKTYEFQSQLQAFTTLHLWHALTDFPESFS